MAKVTAQNQKPGSSPEKSYKWEPTDVFEITGLQFATLYHMLQQEMLERGGAPLQLKNDAYQVIMDIFNRGVEQGVIREQNTVQEIQSKVASLFPEENK